MPSTSSHMTPQPTPRSTPFRSTEEDDDSSTEASSIGPLATKTRELGKTSSSEWIDIDDNPPRRRKRTRKTSTRVDGPTPSTRATPRTSISDLGRFVPKLSQIFESDSARQHEKNKDRAREDTSYRRPIRSKNISVQRRQDNKAKFNASMLSVISGLTSTTERSSGSNSTVTQRSYSRAASTRSRMSSRYSTLSQASVSRAASTYAPTISDVNDDARSDISSATASSVRSSLEGSSVVSGTPSSRSTYPSPTFARDMPVKTSKLDYYSSVPKVDIRDDPSEQISVHDFLVEDDQDEDAILPDAEESPLAAHAQPYSGYPLDTMMQDRAASSFQQGMSAALALPSWRSATQHPDNVISTAQDSSVVPPPAPDAPDNSQKTLVGYEMLANELCSSSSVKPMYRKFEYLNHRLLLHLQDELAELEEQLRTTDEMIAQMGTDAGYRGPSSRRGEAYYGVDLHHYRTTLLGRIFIKTKQYNKAMSSYSTMVRKCLPAGSDEVESYRAWLKDNEPIHEVETQFLQDKQDLVVFRPGAVATSSKTKNNEWSVYLPLLFAMPMVLVGFIQSITLRLVLLGTLLAAVSTVALATDLLATVRRRDLIAGVTSYTVCYIVVAALVPTHSIAKD